MSYDIEEQDHIAWTAPGVLTPTVDFPYDEIDDRLAEIEALPPGAQTEAATVLARLFAWTWDGNGSLQSSLVKFTAVFMGLRPDLVDKTYIQVGKEAGGLTKQSISKSILRAERILGLKFRRTRSKVARQHMSEVRLLNPVYRNGGRRKDAA